MPSNHQRQTKQASNKWWSLCSNKNRSLTAAAAKAKKMTKTNLVCHTHTHSKKIPQRKSNEWIWHTCGQNCQFLSIFFLCVCLLPIIIIIHKPKNFYSFMFLAKQTNQKKKKMTKKHQHKKNLFQMFFFCCVCLSLAKCDNKNNKANQLVDDMLCISVFLSHIK